MTCRTLFDDKSVAYDTQAYSNYMSAIGETFQQILIHKDGLTIDTKSENAEYTELNGTRYTDGERVPLRQIGTLKFTKNFDSSLIDNHSELIKAGLGNILGGAGTSVVVSASSSACEAAPRVVRAVAASTSSTRVRAKLAKPVVLNVLTPDEYTSWSAVVSTAAIPVSVVSRGCLLFNWP